MVGRTRPISARRAEGVWACARGFGLGVQDWGARFPDLSPAENRQGPTVRSEFWVQKGLEIEIGQAQTAPYGEELQTVEQPLYSRPYKP